MAYTLVREIGVAAKKMKKQLKQQKDSDSTGSAGSVVYKCFSCGAKSTTLELTYDKDTGSEEQEECFTCCPHCGTWLDEDDDMCEQ